MMIRIDFSEQDIGKIGSFAIRVGNDPDPYETSMGRCRA
jgi:hypothetical protein